MHNASPIPIEGQLIDINLQKRRWNNCSLFPYDSSGTAGEEEEEEEEHQKVSLLHSRQYMGILCSVTSTTLSVLECRREPMRLFWSVRDPKIVMWMVNEQNVYLYKAVDYSPFCTGLLRFFPPQFIEGWVILCIEICSARNHLREGNALFLRVYQWLRTNAANLIFFK